MNVAIQSDSSINSSKLINISQFGNYLLLYRMTLISVLLLVTLLAGKYSHSNRNNLNLIIIGLVTGDPTECYYCSKGLSGCSDPLDLTTASICQMDSISSSLTSLKIFETQKVTFASVSGGTCTKLSMSNGTHSKL